jgi:hypothetical protein
MKKIVIDTSMLISLAKIGIIAKDKNANYQQLYGN